MLASTNTLLQVHKTQYDPNTAESCQKENTEIMYSYLQ